jgi:hypothetical protein
MAPLPLIKIAAVFFKEISKPIAASLKAHAHTHPRFRGFAIALGRNYELASQRVEALLSKGPRNALAKTSFKPVPEQQAFTVGTDLLTQAFLLSTAIGLVVLEYVRAQNAKDAESAEKATQKAIRRSAKEARLVELERSLADVSSRLMTAELALESASSAARGGSHLR